MSTLETRISGGLVAMRSDPTYSTLFRPSGSDAQDRAHAAIARRIAINRTSRAAGRSAPLASEQRALDAAGRQYQAAMYDVAAETPQTMSPAFLLALL